MIINNIFIIEVVKIIRVISYKTNKYIQFFTIDLRAFATQNLLKNEDRISQIRFPYCEIRE